MAYIQRIGMEIEGGWHDIHSLPDNPVHWHHDDSVRITQSKYGRPLGFIGEAVTRRPLDSIAKAREWINIYWPDRKNKSCGFHIHVSLDPKHYVYLMEEEFFIAFHHEMYKIGEELKLSKYFFDRLAGNNSYCQCLFDPLTQVVATQKDSSRYTQLNYCFSLHGTLENRLPCAILSVDQAADYTEKYIIFINRYLDSHPKGDHSFMFADEFEINS